MLRSLYYKIKYCIEKKHIEKLYKKNTVGLIYSNRYKAYVHPAIPYEIGDIEYILSELTRTGLYYSYTYTKEGEIIDGHSHSFGGVLREAYENPESFSPNQDHYSTQELKLLQKICEYSLKEKQTSNIPQ